MAKKSRLPKGRPARTLLLCAVIVVIFCVSVLGYNAYQDLQTTKAPKDATTAFLNDLQTNSFADAYTELCPATQADFSQSEFKAYVRKQPGIHNHTPLSGKIRKVNGITSAIVVVDILHTGGTEEHRSIVLQQVKGRWLVCGQPY